MVWLVVVVVVVAFGSVVVVVDSEVIEAPDAVVVTVLDGVDEPKSLD